MLTQQTYSDVIAKTEQMVSNRSAQKLAAKHGLGIVNVTWEDTGRYKGSAVGPNIGDISPDLFFVLVGNEKGEDLRKITLRELLGNLRCHLHDPSSWKGNRKSL